MNHFKFLKSLFKFATKTPSPLSLIHFVTNRCNARCPFCFIDFNDKKTQDRNSELSLSEIAALSKTLGPSIEHINLTGGEPFLRSDLLEIARLYVKNAGLSSILFSTNGSFPDRVQELVLSLKDEFPQLRIYVCMSIDSFPEKHDEIRSGKNLFFKVIEIYRFLDSLGPKVYPKINITVSSENFKDAVPIYNLLKVDYKINNISAIIAREAGVTKIEEDLKPKIRDAYRDLTRKIMSDNLAKNFQEKDLRGKLVRANTEIQYNLIGDLYLNPHFVSYCPAASTFGVIGADGRVLSCEIKKFELGNLRDHQMSLMKLWHAKESNLVRNHIRQGKCFCLWDNALTYNIFSNYLFYPRLMAKTITSYLRQIGI